MGLYLGEKYKNSLNGAPPEKKKASSEEGEKPKKEDTSSPKKAGREFDSVGEYNIFEVPPEDEPKVYTGGTEKEESTSKAAPAKTESKAAKNQPKQVKVEVEIPKIDESKKSKKEQNDVGLTIDTNRKKTDNTFNASQRPASNDQTKTVAASPIGMFMASQIEIEDPNASTLVSPEQDANMSDSGEINFGSFDMGSEDTSGNTESSGSFSFDSLGSADSSEGSFSMDIEPAPEAETETDDVIRPLDQQLMNMNSQSDVRAAQAKADAERRAKERAEAERIAREKAEAERIAREKAEAERIAREKAEAKRIAREKAEAERIAREKAEAERIAREKAEAERIAREKAEAERIAREKAEAERIAREKAEAERIAREKAETERKAKAKAEADRIAKEKAEAEAKAKAEAERKAKEEAEAKAKAEADAKAREEARRLEAEALKEIENKENEPAEENEDSLSEDEIREKHAKAEREAATKVSTEDIGGLAVDKDQTGGTRVFSEADLAKMKKLMDILEAATEQNASDIHIAANGPTVLRIDGDLVEQEGMAYSPYEMDQMLRVMLTDKQLKELKEMGELDFAYSLPGYARIRFNAFRNRGAYAMALRILSSEIPDPVKLGLPQSVIDLTKKRRGLVLVTGATGSGKSTTLAALVGLIARTYPKNIITLEDPIEYLHSNQKSIVTQREIGYDTMSYANGVRAALREDPDVILVGEMRDLETIETAIRAAETGHLVFSTLHTNSAADTIDRVIDVFPPHQQQQVRVQFANVMLGIVAQQLLPKVGHGRIGAFEVLLRNPAISNLIREGKSFQIPSTIQTSRKEGMVMMDDYIYELFQRGIISQDTAVTFAHDSVDMAKKIHSY